MQKLIKEMETKKTGYSKGVLEINKSIAFMAEIEK